MVRFQFGLLEMADTRRVVVLPTYATLKQQTLHQKNNENIYPPSFSWISS